MMELSLAFKGKELECFGDVQSTINDLSVRFSHLLRTLMVKLPKMPMEKVKQQDLSNNYDCGLFALA